LGAAIVAPGQAKGMSLMFVFTWNQEWETGEPAIDMQHKRLILQLEMLSVALATGKEKPETERTLLLLGDYIEYHFQGEETLMENFQYPNLARHKAAHEEMRGQVRLLVENYLKDSQSAPPAVAEFLLAWLKGHFTTEDREMARFLRQVVPIPLGR
jgi:hemerythrin-like metal-binding protein